MRSKQGFERRSLLPIVITAGFTLRIFLISGLLTTAVFAADEAAAVPEQPRKLHIFSGLGSNIVDCFTGYNLIGWAAIPITTATLVNTDVDEKTSSGFARNQVFSRNVHVAFLKVGEFLPIVPHATMFIYGYFWGSGELSAAGAAGVQAVGLTGGFTTFLKWVSGRPSPRYDIASDSTPRDKEFNFNIMEQSVTSGRYRWPSGHTSSMFAMASAFYGFYPEKTWIAFVGYPAAGLMGFVMMEGHYHWASDVLAGGILGTIIGLTVGRNFRRMYSGTQTTTKTIDGKRALDWYLMPRQTENGMALAMSAVF